MNLGVVVAVRNAASTLPAALRSITEEVARLAPMAVDIVVIDGDSADGSTQIAAGVTGLRVIAQSGRGLAQARNQGVAEVGGEVLAFLDADDRWAAGGLVSRLQVLADRPEVAGVVGLMATEPVGDAPARHTARLGRPVPAHTPGGLVIRRDAFELVGPFDERLHIAADSDWFVRARTTGIDLLLLDEVVLHKGVRSDSLSTDVVRYRQELLEVGRRFLEGREPRP